MKIELMGGPVDGEIVEVPDETKLWIVPVTLTNVRKFYVQETGFRNDMVPNDQGDYAYGITRNVRGDGTRLFEFIGERAVK